VDTLNKTMKLSKLDANRKMSIFKIHRW